MSSQILKETIADHGFEETLAAMIELIKDGYILEFDSLQNSNLLRFQLNDVLTGLINLDAQTAIIDVDFKDVITE
jgi:hypothetical protein